MQIGRQIVVASAISIGAFSTTAKAALSFAFAAPNGSALAGLQTDNPALYTTVLNGFQAAADLWSARFDDNVLVRIEIDFPALSPGILGQAGSNSGVYSYSTLRGALANDRTSTDDFTAHSSLSTGPSFAFRRKSLTGSGFVNETGANPIAQTVSVHRATARAVGLIGNGDTASDATIQFSSNYNWDFDRSNGIAANSFDFVGVAAHEIGHAMGFSSGVDMLDYYTAAFGPGAGSLTDSQISTYTVLSPLDLYRYASSGQRDVSVDVADYFSIDGGATNLGRFSNGYYNGSNGYQASHWLRNTGLGIMEPAVAPGTLASISARDVQALDVIGWTQVPEPGTLAAISAWATVGLLRRRRSPATRIVQ